MNRCLTDQLLLQLHAGEATAEQRFHVRICADCAERYEELAGDLATITRTLAGPPPRVLRTLPLWRHRAVLGTLACAASALCATMMVWRLNAVSHRTTVSPSTVAAFADDVSAAVFTPTDTAALTFDTSVLAAALDGGRPCTGAGVLSGDCTDEVSALAADDEF